MPYIQWHEKIYYQADRKIAWIIESHKEYYMSSYPYEIYA